MVSRQAALGIAPYPVGRTIVVHSIIKGRLSAGAVRQINWMLVSQSLVRLLRCPQDTSIRAHCVKMVRLCVGEQTTLVSQPHPMYA